MNTNNVISFEGAVDLTGKEYLAVKMTATGIDLAASGDKVIGTILRGQIKREDNVYLGQPVAVQLKAGSVHYVKLGIVAGSLAKGAGLILDAANAGHLVASETNPIAQLVQAVTGAQTLGGVAEAVFI